jgi:hypothetical protein
MPEFQYCTNHWLDECKKNYFDSDKLQEPLQEFPYKVAYRVEAEPRWGIDNDMIFCTYFANGELTKMDFLNEDDAFDEADFVLGAPPQEWKKILLKERKFVSDFMFGRINLEKGSRIKLLKLSTFSEHIVNIFAEIPVQYPDQMTELELEHYRKALNEFSANL